MVDLDKEVLCLLFFFSSRRRHTRLTCDWSSDVCSSDLRAGMGTKSIDADIATGGSAGGMAGNLAALSMVGCQGDLGNPHRPLCNAGERGPEIGRAHV